MRLIDADALYESILTAEMGKVYKFCFPCKEIQQAIDEQPTIQPTDADIQKMQDIEQAMLEKAYECGKQDAAQWIPCSERLPDLWDEKYLVSLAWGGVGTMEYKSTGFHNYGSFSPVPIETVTAWMPLPEPWEGEQS